MCYNHTHYQTQAIAHAPSAPTTFPLRMALLQLYSNAQQWQLAGDAAEEALKHNAQQHMDAMQHPTTYTPPSSTYAHNTRMHTTNTMNTTTASTTALSAAWEPTAYVRYVLAQAQHALGETTQAVEVLQQALAVQSKYVQRQQQQQQATTTSSANGAPKPSADIHTQAAQNAATLCCAIASMLPESANPDAILEQALTFDHAHVPSLVQRAQHAFGRRDLDACAALCARLLHVDPGHVEAHLMMTDILCAQVRCFWWGVHKHGG